MMNMRAPGSLLSATLLATMMACGGLHNAAQDVAGGDTSGDADVPRRVDGNGGGGGDGGGGTAPDAAACPSPPVRLLTNAGPRAVPPPCVGVPVHPGDDVQSLLDAHPAAGTVFCFATGRYRLERALRPFAGQQLLGAGRDVVFDGTRVVIGFQSDGSGRFFVDGQAALPVGQLVNGQAGCLPEFAARQCLRSEGVFLDGRWLLPVGSLAELAPGRFFFDDPAHRIYLADDPAARTVEVVVATGAIAESHGLVLRDLTVQRFGNAMRTNAVGAIFDGIIEHVEISWTRGIGLGIYGGVLRDSYVHHNGQMGLGGGGRAPLVEGNEIAYNDVAGVDPSFEGGGAKFSFSDGAQILDNALHHNRGVGFITDVNNSNALYRGNTVEDNSGPGLMHEIGYHAVFANNTIRRNGWDPTSRWWVSGAGITITNSSEVEIYGNTLEDNYGGIALEQDSRYDPMAAPPNDPARTQNYRGPWNLRDISVHDNTITMWSGQSGLLIFPGAHDPVLDYFHSHNILFDRNQYRMADEGLAYWSWQDTAPSFAQGYRSFAGWQGFGQDVHGNVGPRAVPAGSDLFTESFSRCDGEPWPAERWPQQGGSVSEWLQESRGGEGRLRTGDSAANAEVWARPAVVATADAEASVRLRRADGGATGHAELWIRAVAFETAARMRGYIARVTWNGTDATAELVKRSYDNEPLRVPVAGFRVNASAAVRLRLRAQGQTISLRAWADGTPEPGDWGAQFTDSDIAAGTTRVGVASSAPAAVDVRFSDFRFERR